MPKTTTTPLSSEALDEIWHQAKELKDALAALVAESVDSRLWPAVREIHAEAVELLRRVDELEEMAEQHAAA